jgi:hypothetical protein
LVGEPLCPYCFDYRGAVLWNAHVPALWARTSLNLYLEVARAARMNDREVRTVARLSYMKVVEFQRRGLVHVHAVVRADGSEGPSDSPPAWLDAPALSAALSRAIARTSVRASSTTASWGRQQDVRVLVAGDDDDSTAVAAYVAKYATKTADGTAGLAHPVRSAAEIERLDLRPHIRKLVRTSWILGGRTDLAHLRLRAHAHTLGYAGQFSSKSLRFSTTFAALRQARVLYARGESESDPDDVSDYDGEWRYVGRGYSDPEADRLVASLHDAARRVPRFVPEASRNRSHEP